MTSTISATRFRLLCQEIASKVNARRSRQEATRPAVLLELLRRVENHLGQRPVAVAKSATNDTRGITDAIDRLVDSSAQAAWPGIVEKELLGKVGLSNEAEPKGTKESARKAGT